VSRAKAKSSAPPASATRAAAAIQELPPDVKLISQAELDNIEESLHSVRRHLATMLFNAEDGTSDSPAFSLTSVRENLLQESAAALMSLNILEEALWSANDPEPFLVARAHEKKLEREALEKGGAP
jgi:hypothetical protein